MDQRSRELAAADLDVVLRTENGRRFLTHLVYEVCGVKMLRYDHAVKEGPSADNRGAFLDGMACIGLQIEEAAQMHAPTSWCQAERERLARLEMVLTRTPKPKKPGDENA